MKTIRKLVRVGSSLAVIIPKEVCEYIGITQGDYVEFQNLKKYKVKK